MAGLKALTLAGAAVLTLVTGASAADLLPAPPPLEPLPPVADFSGWYLRGDVGIGLSSANVDLQNSPDPLLGTSPGGLPYSSAATEAFNNTTLSESGMFDVGVGYQFNRWLRGDLTVEYRGGANLQSLYTINDPTPPTTQYSDFYRANVSSVIGLANGYADIGTWYGVTPFVGAGVGFAHNMVNGFTDQGFGYYNGGNTFLGSAGGYFGNGSQNQFAWALMTGLDFDVTPNLKLELGYRYLNYGKITTGGSNCLSAGPGGAFGTNNCNAGVSNVVSSTSNLASSDFRLGLIWMLGDNSPPPPPQPLVRKY
jgi:opacity protein-like surface antigen